MPEVNDKNEKPLWMTEDKPFMHQKGDTPTAIGTEYKTIRHLLIGRIVEHWKLSHESWSKEDLIQEMSNLEEYGSRGLRYESDDSLKARYNEIETSWESRNDPQRSCNGIDCCYKKH